jgi:HEAT repeat protein
MRKRAKNTAGKRRSTSVKRRGTLAAILKWVGAATAVLSLVFGVYQLVRTVGDIRAQHRQVVELLKLGKDQQAARDYTAAWASFAKAAKAAQAGGEIAKLLGSLSADQRRTREARENLAMVWAEDVHVPEGKTFSDVVDKLIPVLTRGAEGTTGVREADLLAHIGWANFLRSRDGVLNLAIEEKYREALQIDPANPYAHAMWGHWLIVDGNHLREAKQHFAAAVKSGRERPFVRQYQLAALEWVGEDENKMELIRVCNDMRKDHEPLSQEDRRRILSHTIFLYMEAPRAKLAEILPADEDLATYRWLLRGTDTTQSNYQNFALARLSEAAGDCDTAQRLYVLLLGTTTSSKVREGLERCRQRFPELKPDVELLTELLNDESADVRRQAVEGLGTLLANNDPRLDPKVILPALRDPAASVRDAAADPLASSAPQALPPLIEMLGSADPMEQARAARVVARMGDQGKAAVPALVRVLGGSSSDTQEAAVDALGSIGPDAGPAVAPLTQMLRERPSIDRQKSLIYALGEIGPASAPAVPLIIEALREPRDREGFLNAVAADALGKIGPGARAALPALVAALGSDDGRLITAATGALGNLGADAKAAIPALVQAMAREEPEYKKYQAEAIGQIAQALAVRRDRSSLDVLRAALRAEESAGLGVETIAPLREAVDDLESARPKHAHLVH